MQPDYLMIAAVICAFTVKGMCGFANTLVFTSIVSFQRASVQVTPVDMLLSIPANVLITVRERKFLVRKTWLPLAAVVIVSSIPGIFLLKFGDVTFVKRILGVAIAGIGIEMLLRERRGKAKKASPVLLLAIAVVSGFLCGLFGIGALLSAYIGRTTETTRAFRGNLSLVLLVDNLFRLVVYLAMGILTWPIAKSALFLFPFMLLGLLAGMFLAHAMNEKRMKTIVIVMLIVSGVALFLINTL